MCQNDTLTFFAPKFALVKIQKTRCFNTDTDINNGNVSDAPNMLSMPQPLQKSLCKGTRNAKWNGKDNDNPAYNGQRKRNNETKKIKNNEKVF